MTAADPGPEQEGRLAGALFEAVLDRTEPPVPAVLAPVRERGRRLRRARQVRAGLIGAVCTGATVLLVANLTAGPGTVAVGSFGPGPVPVGPSASASGSPSPSATPHGRPTDLAGSYLLLWNAVREAAPQRLGVMHLIGSAYTELLLTEPGSPSPQPGQPTAGVRLGARGGLRLEPGQAPVSPCSLPGARPDTVCEYRVLGDGSRGWFTAFGGPDPRLEATFASPAGTVFGLSAVNLGGGPELTLAELEDMVGRAPVHTAMLGTQETSPGGPSPLPSGWRTGTPSGSSAPSGSSTPTSSSSSFSPSDLESGPG